MKRIALLLALVLSMCATAFADRVHVEPAPIRWYAIYVWTTGKGMEYIDPPSVKKDMPMEFHNRERCEWIGGLSADRLNEKHGGFGRPSVRMVCIAARNKLQLRNFLRDMDLNFGGRPA